MTLTLVPKKWAYNKYTFESYSKVIANVTVFSRQTRQRNKQTGQNIYNYAPNIPIPRHKSSTVNQFSKDLFQTGMSTHAQKCMSVLLSKLTFPDSS